MYEFLTTKKHTSPPDDVACKTCLHLKGAVFLWCTHAEAVKERGTNFPGAGSCPFWECQRTWEDVVKEYQRDSWFRTFFNLKPDETFYIRTETK